MSLQLDLQCVSDSAGSPADFSGTPLTQSPDITVFSSGLCFIATDFVNYSLPILFHRLMNGSISFFFFAGSSKF